MTALDGTVTGSTDGGYFVSPCGVRAVSSTSKLCALIALAILSTVTYAQNSASSLIGTWRVVQYEDHSPKGELRFPYGERPAGLLIYDPTGHMSIQIMKTPHPKVASGDDEIITTTEKLALFDAYNAYFGTYTVDAAHNVVTHHVEGDMFDVFIGKFENRPYELNGDRLTIRTRWKGADGQQWEGIRVFERVK